MNLVIGFVPFILFVLLSRLSADLALWIAFGTAFVVMVRDFVESPSLRLLDAGSFTLFGALALTRGFFDPSLTLAAVHFIAELSLFLLLCASLAFKRPFSADYSKLDPRESVWPAEFFLRVNYHISGLWTAAFFTMALADAMVAFSPRFPLYGGIAVNVVALAIAVTFTLRYPALAAKRAALPPAA